MSEWGASAPLWAVRALSFGPLARRGACNGPPAPRYDTGVGQAAVNAPDTPIPYNRTTTMSVTIPTTTDIGTTLERIARTIAVLIAATLAAGAVTRSALTAFATFARNLTSRPLRTLIELIPTVPKPSPTPTTIDLLGAEILTGDQLMGEIAGYDANAKRKRPAATRPTVRRRPAGAREPVAVGA